MDPKYGEISGPSHGSGFIIDPSGLAITNNHVVSGAAQLKVWIGDNQNEFHNARLVAVSECSDLAMIDIEGSGFPFLGWYPDPIISDLEIFAAGYPFGEPEYTISSGSISDEEYRGEFRWASLEQVLEHNATINPGNSGGPLVTSGGELVGVNYASHTESERFFAISRDTVLPLIEKFYEGDDVDSLGVNAFSASNSDGSLAGIWVSSVISGSAADQAGIEPGDLITSMEGISLGEDNSMAAYCDILRTQGDESQLGIEVVRLTSNENLEGQFNGRELVVTGTFQDPESAENGSAVDTDLSAGPYADPGAHSSELITEEYDDGFMAIKDDTGALSIEVPDDWRQIDGMSWTEYWGDLYFEAANLAAAPDLRGFYSSNEDSGVRFSASADWGAIGGYIQLLDGVKHWYNTSCVWKLREDFNNGVYEGAYDFWDCGSDLGAVVLSARPMSNRSAFLILVQVHGVKDLEEEALDRMMNSFKVVGSSLP